MCSRWTFAVTVRTDPVASSPRISHTRAFFSLPFTGQSSDGAGELDLSLPRLASDVAEFLESFVAPRLPAGSPSVILLGHSLGGSIATEVAATFPGDFARVCGLVLVDSSESQATASLEHFAELLDTRPARFDSKEDAAAWM